jgi:cell division protein FtsZ
VAKADTTFKEAFQMADEVLQQGVRSITDLMVMPGLINLDFADVRSVMGEMGKAMMGTGEGSGENRALEAAERAIANPLLDGVSMQGAKGVIISIIGGDDMKLLEVDEAANHIRELVDPNANIIWGSAFNPDLSGKIRVSVVATGIEQVGEATGEAAARTFNLNATRGPARPASVEAVQPLFERGLAAPEPATGESTAAESDDGLEPLELANSDEAASADADAATGTEPGSTGHDDWGSPSEPASSTDAAEPLELSLDAEAETSADVTGDSSNHDDGLLGDASRLAEADEPVSSPLAKRRRGLVASSGDESSNASAGGSSGDVTENKPARLPLAGNTLFERMANLSRGSRSAPEEDDEESDGTASLSIPRFLGRQNNQ